MPAYHRTQILLEPDQHSYLRIRAKQEKQSISALVREIIDAHCKSEAIAKEQLLQQRLAALESLTKFREALFAKHGTIYDGDIIQQIRDERDADIERVLRG